MMTPMQPRRRSFTCALLLAALALGPACGGGGGSGDDDDDQPPDAAVPPLGEVSPAIHVDHLGWRPGDRKVAVLVDRPGVTVELRRGSDGAVVGTYTSGALEADEDSGDQVARVDFSDATTPGGHYLYLPDEGLRSYLFRIADDVYDIVGAAAAKSFYFQRCNHDKALPHAGDALLGFDGLGGQWVDSTCHGGDTAAPAGPGSADHGALDLRGGWHDAGDYQKTLWGRGVPELLFAYEVNPGAWPDGQLAIPESGNGVPDLLDEVAWELDFYVRMQRPDGHFMSSVKGRGDTSVSPPSTSDQGRVYFDATSPSGDGWSGGGVTLTLATANATLALAHAAIVYAPVDGDAADRYEAAARAGWAWLAGVTPADATERRLRVAAAAAVTRLDGGVTSARAVVEGFAWSTWDGLRGGGGTPSEGMLTTAAWHYLSATGGDAGVRAAMITGVREIVVDGAFAEAGAYGGMFGGPGNGWEWSWGSNRQQSYYGANLMMATRFADDGALGTRAEADVIALAQQHLHDLLGLNPLAMVYLSNMAAYGGEHSSFHVYHGWFSHDGADGDHGNPQYDGKPAAVDEPLYPYHPDDANTSTYGPAPGLLVGGPNWYYAGLYDIPNAELPAYAYRDFSVGCDWDGAQCRAAAWELTEPMAAYQGPFVLLASWFMSAP
jgi:hypothetical protein